MDNMQNLEEVKCIDGYQKQKSKKRRHQNKYQMEELKCIYGNQKRKSKKEEVIRGKLTGQ